MKIEKKYAKALIKQWEDILSCETLEDKFQRTETCDYCKLMYTETKRKNRSTSCRKCSFMELCHTYLKAKNNFKMKRDTPRKRKMTEHQLNVICEHIRTEMYEVFKKKYGD